MDYSLWLLPLAGAVQQQALLPTHADPKLWTVETRGGSAREACIKLMQKAINKTEAGEPLLIRSVFYQEHLKVGVLLMCQARRQSSALTSFLQSGLDATVVALEAIHAFLSSILGVGASEVGFS